MNLTTVIFDLSEVLIAGLVGIEHSLSDQLQQSPAEINAAFGSERLYEICCGRITEDEYLSQIIDEQQWPLSKQTLKDAIRQNFRQPVLGMQPLLAELAPVYELVLLSDHAAEWVADIRQLHPFLEQFDALFFSYELGRTKREAATFQMVLEALGREPATCLFIDDNLGNVRVARSLGIEAIHFTGAAQLRRELAAAGVLPVEQP